MHRTVGLLYIATGLLCDFADMLIAGAMLGMTTPIYSVSSLIIPPLLGTGQALLVLTGVTTITGGTRRSVVCLITGIAVLAGLALWTIPRIGWPQSAWLFLEPEAGSYLIASLILLVIRKRWIAALIGIVISAPVFVFGTGYLIYALLFGKAVLSLTEIWIVVPTIMLMVSFLSAVRVRFA
jgi:hypothetical protein